MKISIAPFQTLTEQAVLNDEVLWALFKAKQNNSTCSDKIAIEIIIAL